MRGSLFDILEINIGITVIILIICVIGGQLRKRYGAGWMKMLWLLLAQLGIQSVEHACFLPMEGIGPGAVVCGCDAGIGRFSVLSPQIQALSMAAHRQGRHIPGRYARLFDHLTNAGAVRPPHLLHVPLLISGARGEDRGALRGHRRFGTVQTEQGGLNHRAAIVHTHHILRHLSHSFPLCRLG